MKQLLFILLLLPVVLLSQVSVQEVTNGSPIKKIEDRDVTFGVKEEVEEILLDNGYQLDSNGMVVWVSIEKIESPQQILNILGTKWLKKSYIVETKICIGSGCFIGKGKRNTFLFAAFLDVENNEIPLNRKAFSKALQAALKDNVKFNNNINK